jgi:hypothetical protein
MKNKDDLGDHQHIHGAEIQSIIQAYFETTKLKTEKVIRTISK